MRIIVCVKQVASLGYDIEFRDDEKDVDQDFVDYEINEWDTYGVEEALRAREVAGDGEVVVIAAGEARCEEVLQRCMAMGADRAVRVWSDELNDGDPVRVARALAAAIEPEDPQLVLCGAQSSDAAHGATGAALAGLLGLPCVAVVTKVEWDFGQRRAVVERELEGGLIDVVELDLPAVITIQSGANEPRYVSMRAMLAARQQPIPVVIPRHVGEPVYEVRRMFVPHQKRAEMLSGQPARVAEQIRAIVEGTLGR